MPMQFQFTLSNEMSKIELLGFINLISQYYVSSDQTEVNEMQKQHLTLMFTMGHMRHTVCCYMVHNIHEETNDENCEGQLLLLTTNIQPDPEDWCHYTTAAITMTGLEPMVNVGTGG